MSTTSYTGSIKWFDPAKSFGFITPDGARSKADELFLHQRHCDGFVPRDGQRVKFQVREDRFGKGVAAAVNVEPI